MGYPSLQGNRQFDSVADAVAVLDQMVLRLSAMELHQRAAIEKLRCLPVKRRGRYAREVIEADLQREADKTSDSLSVYGFLT